jgi:hypothetical protein
MTAMNTTKNDVMKMKSVFPQLPLGLVGCGSGQPSPRC